MTPNKAEELAARTLAAIADERALWDDLPRMQKLIDADRERVASDLAGLRGHRDIAGDCNDCAYRYPCPDAARYADGLRRTANFYGEIE